MVEPRVRALAVHDALRLLDPFEPGTEARVRSLIPSESLEIIDRASAHDWIPAHHDHHVPESIIEVLGPRSDAYFRWVLARHLESTVFRSLLESTRRLFGVNPGSFVRATPLGWHLAFRDFCEPVVVERGPQFAVLDLEKCAPEVFAHPAYVDSWTGFFNGYYDLSDHVGAARARIDPDRARVRYTFEW